MRLVFACAIFFSLRMLINTVLSSSIFGPVILLPLLLHLGMEKFSLEWNSFHNIGSPVNNGMLSGTAMDVYHSE